MFATETRHENGFDKIVLKHVPSNTFAEIVPSCGAILYSFAVIYDNAPLNIIDHVETAADFEMNVRSSGFKSCKLSPFACRIDNARYSFAGKEYELQKLPPETAALHGLLYNAKFEVLEHYADMERAGVSLIYSYSGTDPGYPFWYDCLVTYELKDDNVLDIVTTIVNKDKGLLPIQDGWHPYFKFGGKIDALQLEFQSKSVMVFNDALIPTGETLPYDSFSALASINDTYLNHCFILNFAECQPLCVLRDTEKELQLEIWPGRQYPYLQIYTPDHRNSIAIENLSAPPDAFNNKIGLITLQPEERIIFTTSYKISKLSG